MIILTIKQPGLYITVPGIPPFRTPASVDITKINMTMLLASLQNAGVEEFDIKKDSNIKLQKEQTKSKIIKQEDPSEDLSDRLESIEELLQKVLEKEPAIIQQVIETKGKRTKKKVKHDDDIDFIPEINVDSMKGSITHETTLGEDNTEDTADLLRQMTKEKNKFKGD